MTVFNHQITDISLKDAVDLVNYLAKIKISWTVVVAQLVERLLLIPEVRSSNQVIGKNLYCTFYCQLYWKEQNKEKEAANGPFLKRLGSNLLNWTIIRQFCNFHRGSNLPDFPKSLLSFPIYFLSFLRLMIVVVVMLRPSLIVTSTGMRRNLSKSSKQKMLENRFAPKSTN